ncbi:hypothetical protein GGX14DRAFT_553413 [Mycena pura]|uniref:Uncharacterized protein n=1 Tax=Mycena pura TaxID=153505 RepID=A0AAD7E5E8_9AGAR|nr:hypothetical protein GGX14DRAFT_553413 [Mycena pura]
MHEHHRMQTATVFEEAHLLFRVVVTQTGAISISKLASDIIAKLREHGITFADSSHGSSIAGLPFEVLRPKRNSNTSIFNFLPASFATDSAFTLAWIKKTYAKFLNPFATAALNESWLWLAPRDTPIFGPVTDFPQPMLRLAPTLRPEFPSRKRPCLSPDSDSQHGLQLRQLLRQLSRDSDVGQVIDLTVDDPGAGPLRDGPNLVRQRSPSTRSPDSVRHVRPRPLAHLFTMDTRAEILVSPSTFMLPPSSPPPGIFGSTGSSRPIAVHDCGLPPANVDTRAEILVPPSTFMLPPSSPPPGIFGSTGSSRPIAVHDCGLPPANVSLPFDSSEPAASIEPG